MKILEMNKEELKAITKVVTPIVNNDDGCVDCIHCIDCYACTNCVDCIDCSYCVDCCYSEDLEHKQYVFNNIQLTKNEYYKALELLSNERV